MGEVFKAMAKLDGSRMRARQAAKAAAPGSGGIHTADYLIKKHRFEQGLGPNPDATGLPAPAAETASPDTPAAPPGGQVLTPDEEKVRRSTGLRI